MIISESPCYFLEFLSKEIQLNWEQRIFTDFQLFHEMGKHFTFASNVTATEASIISLPFPFQIRVNYFSIQQLINNSHFQFTKLYRSFCNLTSHSSRDDIGFQRPWQDLRSIFKCSLAIHRNSRFNEPSINRIVSNNNLPISQEIPDSIPPIVNIPEIKTSDQPPIEDVYIGLPPGPNEPVNTNGQVKNPSTSTLPVMSFNETSIEDSISITDKNTTIDNVVKDVRMNKTTMPAKESEFENTNRTAEAQTKTNVPKSKSEEIFDQKFSASPGSNAWNQAFMRIKNMAKQLEVNVSISMQYLEELSQNYKQQTERLKKAQFSMSENVSSLENLIHQHRQETQTSLQHFNIQLQSLMLKMKYGFSSKHVKSNINLSDITVTGAKCVDLLTEELFVSSWSDSPYFMVFVNVMLSMMCNLVVLSLVYNRLKVKIISEIGRSAMFPPTLDSNYNQNLPFSYVEDLSMYSVSRSCSDLTSANVTYPHPVVLPPRGVNLSFADPDRTISDQEQRSHGAFQRELGPHFYPVQPNLNFVTPSKVRSGRI